MTHAMTRAMTRKKWRAVMITVYILLILAHFYLRSQRMIWIPFLTIRDQLFGVNLIPFFGFSEYIQFQLPFIGLMKIGFYAVISAPLLFFSDRFQHKTAAFWCLSAATIALESLLRLIFQNGAVIFEINNLLLYGIGLLLGRWIFLSIRKKIKW